MKTSPSSAASTCVLFHFSAPPSHFPLGRCHHGQIVHRKELERAHNFLSVFLFNTSSLSPAEICIYTTRKAASVCCACVRACEELQKVQIPALGQQAWLSSLSAFLSALLFFFPPAPGRTERRGRQSGGGTEDRRSFFLPLFCFLSPFPVSPFP